MKDNIINACRELLRCRFVVLRSVCREVAGAMVDLKVSAHDEPCRFGSKRFMSSRKV